MRTFGSGAYLTLMVVAAVHAGCEDTVVDPDPQPLPAAIQVSGNGDIAVHPSANAAFGAAIEFPIRIEETGGGTAIWNFFRVSYFRDGVEVERNERGADDIQAAGHRNIGARATITADVIARTNAVDWDDVELRLGFIDNMDGRAFEQVLSLASFEGVVLDFTPALLPEGSSFAIIETTE